MTRNNNVNEIEIPDGVTVWQPFPRHRMVAMLPAVLLSIGFMVAGDSASGCILLCGMMLMKCPDDVLWFLEQRGTRTIFRDNKTVFFLAWNTGVVLLWFAAHAFLPTAWIGSDKILGWLFVAILGFDLVVFMGLCALPKAVGCERCSR